MLIDYEYSLGRLHVSFVDANGGVKMKQYRWSDPVQYEVAGRDDPETEYYSWDGRPLTRRTVRYPNRYAVADFMDALPKEDLDEIFAYREPNIYFMDIETEVVDGFPNPKEAPNKVLNIAISCKDKIRVMGLQPLTKEQIAKMEADTNEYFKSFGKKFELKYYAFDSEYAMLYALFNKLIPRMPVLTGWNFVEFDWVYLVNRARKLGIDPNVASPSGRLQKVWSKNPEKPKEAELPVHRVIVDYMELFSKWDTSVKIKDSISLDFVGDKVLGLKKIKYDGTLQQLHDNDYYKYTYYNVVDTVLVQLIHEKNKYLDIMLGIATLCQVRMLDAFSTIRTTEGVLRKPMREKRNIMFVRDLMDETPDTPGVDDTEELLKGGWVKNPNVGMNMWVAVYDFASLYPTTMRQNNIAPESFKGMRIPSTNQCIYQGHVYEIDPTDIVTISGAVFRNEDSVTKETLGSIYHDRTVYKAKMNKAKLTISGDKKKGVQGIKDELAAVEERLKMLGHR